MEEFIQRLNYIENLQKKGAHEREVLLTRICELEDQVEDLTAQLRKVRKDPRPPIASRESIEINNATKETNAQEDEPWLFYTPPGRPIRDILSLLDFSEGYELDARSLLTEEALWIQVLERMNVVDIPSRLSALQKLASVQLASACHNELLIIVRGIPVSAHPLFERILPSILTLAEYVNIAWSEVENNNPDILGRVAVVLECEQEMKVLSVDRGDTRMSLFIERL
ncbi:unnamed protein product [Blepharisma stoltei]|uniref:Apicomplexan specific coiled coil protein n=1 Tax=Blepharisma stoltei TaxID=1481888 RepID=A0AAU9JY70_9CILI|nr:unnamed protein product [Blepharisma stoltei]